MGMYDYGQRGTYVNGLFTYIENNNKELKLETFGDLNVHLMAIRLRKEPNKPVSKDYEKNAFYIQENYDWQNDVVPYFKSLKSMCYKIFINNKWHKDFYDYESAVDYAENSPMGDKVEIRKVKQY